MRKKLYTERIEFCLTEDQRKILNRTANREKLTVNQVIRNLIENYSE